MRSDWSSWVHLRSDWSSWVPVFLRRDWFPALERVGGYVYKYAIQVGSVISLLDIDRMWWLDGKCVQFIMKRTQDWSPTFMKIWS